MVMKTHSTYRFYCELSNSKDKKNQKEEEVDDDDNDDEKNMTYHKVITTTCAPIFLSFNRSLGRAIVRLILL